MFAALSYNEQVRRLIRLAGAALPHYNLKAAELTLIAHWRNTRFRVDTPEQRYALRANHPLSQTLASIRSELLWLEPTLAARVLLLALYYASQTDNPKMRAAAPAYVEGAAADLRTFLKTGRVR